MTLYLFFTGQVITLPARNIEEAVNVTINITEGENVTFMCETISDVSLTLYVRLPGGSFVAASPGVRPPNLRVDGGQTFTFFNAQRRDNGVAFQCRGDGRNATDVGVVSVQCKLHNEVLCTQMTAMCDVTVPFMLVYLRKLNIYSYTSS